MRFLAGTLILAALVVTAAVTSSAATLPNVGGGKFEVTCKPGAIPDQAVDAIVSPGAVSAHEHTFFGSKAVSSTSTVDSLRSSTLGTTCAIPQDTAAYWVPVACNGPCVPAAGGDATRGPFTNAIRPTKVFAYYFGVAGNQEQPFPTSLQMVAGNSHALSPADEVPNTVFFSCGNGGSHSSPNRAAPYDCTAANGVKNTDGVVAIIKFPYCINAAGTLEYGATNNTGNCPTGDTTIGQIQLHVHYGLDATGFQTGSQLNFSSGPYWTYHGDVQEGFQTAKLNSLVAGCLDIDKDCGFLSASNPGP